MDSAANNSLKPERVHWSRVASETIFLAASLLSLALLALFASHNAQLKKQLANEIEDANPHEGDYLPDVPAALIGKEDLPLTVLSSAALPAILYFAAPDCRFCAAQRHLLPRLSQCAEGAGYSFVVVSTAAPSATAAMFPHAFSFPVLAENGGGIRRSYHVHATPLFIAVGKTRRVDRVHAGVFEEARIFARAMLPSGIARSCE